MKPSATIPPQDSSENSANALDASQDRSDRSLIHNTGDRVLSTLNNDGSRRWLNPKLSKGRFLNARRMVAFTLIIIFTALPFIRINHKPAVLLDLAARRFTIFGATFLPTDTLLLALLMVSIFITVFSITAVLGRVWCGWACPQTVYMEFLFRPIERLFGGKGKSSGIIRGSALGKVLKWGVYLVLAFYLANTFLAYFVGVEKLRYWITHSPAEHPVGFLIVAATTGLMLFDFGWFREQVCIVACPYGRFQSVMLDRDSPIVSYDRKRGEPRGAFKRKPAKDLRLPITATTEPAHGDCVDCHLCVTTCPTGIDIRDGLQMECIGCAQCIDACDEVMTRLKRPRGLIRYSSQAAMSGERKHILRPRVFIYATLLLALVSAFAVVLVTRGPARITLLRGLGAPFVEIQQGEIGNQVRIHIINRADDPRTFTISTEGAEGVRMQTEDFPLTLAPGESRTVPALLIAPANAFTRGACNVSVVITSSQDFLQRIPYKLLGPGNTHALYSESYEHQEESHEVSHQ